MSQEAFDYVGMQKIWKHVVLQAFQDACMVIEENPMQEKMPRDFDPNAHPKSKNHGVTSKEKRMEIWTNRRDNYQRKINMNETHRRKAREWLLRPSTDFKLVCEMAGWCPDYIRQRAHVLQQRDWNAPASLSAQLRALC